PEIVNKAVQNYIRKTRQELDEMLGSAIAFYEGRVDNFRAREQEQEAKLMRFEADNPGLDPNDPVGLRQRIIDVEAQIAGVKNSLQSKKAELAALKDFIDNTPAVIQVPRKSENPDYNATLKRRDALQT